MNFKDCLSKAMIKKDPSAPTRVKKSMEIAERFLSSSKKNLAIDECEMVEIAAYNAIFHASRALLFQKQYTERSHLCVIIALKELYKSRYDFLVHCCASCYILCNRKWCLLSKLINTEYVICWYVS